MKKTAFLLICFFTLTNVGAQTMTRLSGVILDKTTRSPVAYASIGIVGKQIGTVANAEGNFLFNTGTNSLNDTIIITGLGYYPFKSVIRELVEERPLIIELTPQVYNLSEVHVNTKKMTAVEILKKAEKKFNENINRNPYLMNAYYREFLMEDSFYVLAVEAATTVYQKYRNKFIEPPVRINAVRSSEDLRQKAYTLVNWMDITLGGSLSLKSLGSWWNLEKYKLDSIFIYNNRLVYRISLHEISRSGVTYQYETIVDKVTGEEWERIIDSVPNASVEECWATFYIDASSFAIVKKEWISIEKYHEFSENKLFNNQWKVDGKTYLVSVSRMHFIIEYQPISEYWYPKHFAETWEWQYHDMETTQACFSITSHSEFFVNEIITDSVKEIPEEQRYVNAHSIFTMKSQYDEEFWKNYNMIPDDSLRREVFRDLEKLKAAKKK